MVQISSKLKTLAFIALSFVVLSTSGCAPLVIGAGMFGASTAADKRTVGAQTQDGEIDVKAELIAQGLKNAHVNAISYNRRLLITGEAPTESIRRAIENKMASIENVQTVSNEIKVGPMTSLTSRANDTYITGKVKAAILADEAVRGIWVKVVTERGEVFLMGRATQSEGDRAAQVVRRIAGVQKVVKMFEYAD